MGRIRRPPAALLSPTEKLRLAALIAVFCALLLCMRQLHSTQSMDWLFEENEPDVDDRIVYVDDVERPFALTAAVQPEELKPADECLKPDHAYFEGIKDRTRSDAIDKEAAMHLLCVCLSRTPEALARESRTDVLFANLFNEPDRHRGQLIHLRGLLRRLVRWDVDAKTNPHGLSHYYEAWIFSEDQRINPCVVLCANVPDGFPVGGALNLMVEVDAYFLKLLAYASEDGNARIAPMLVGGKLWTWQPPPIEAARFGYREWIGLGVALFVMIAAGVAWMRLAKQSAVRERMRQRFAPPAFSPSESPGGESGPRAEAGAVESQ